MKDRCNSCGSMLSTVGYDVVGKSIRECPAMLGVVGKTSNPVFLTYCGKLYVDNREVDSATILQDGKLVRIGGR